MRQRSSLVRGLLTGSAAGLAGALMMAAFQELVATSEAPADGKAAPSLAHSPQPGQENTTETTARTVMAAFGRPLTRGEQQIAGRALHYGFGLAMGAVYGAVAEYLPAVGLGAGTIFGSVLFLGTDEAVLPLLRLAIKPVETPPIEHLLHWASHVVYGSTLELTRNQLVRLS